MYCHTIFPSPLGDITVCASDDAIVRISFHEPPGDCPRQDTHFVLQSAVQWLARYFRGEAPEPSLLPLKPEGTAFQKAVWEKLLTIPYGKTTTYGAIARSFGKPMSAQAVGGAVGRNPIAIVIPCHRVIGTDRSLTGYAYGLERKQYLLNLETTDK